MMIERELDTQALIQEDADTTEGGWIMIFEPEKIASHGNLGCSIPQISAYIANLRALDTLVASELPQMTF